MDIYPAKLVLSKAGRDKNKYFAVIKIIDDNYILLCDGKGRSLEKPKIKKLKHVEDMNIDLHRIKEKLNEGKKITNSDIRKAIKAALAELGEDKEKSDEEV